MSPLLNFLFHDVYAHHPSESGFLGAAADRYKLSVAQFERQLAGLARVRTDAPLLFNRALAADDDSGRFAITVDDGGVSFHTHVADLLEALGWRGHCFVTTGCIGRSRFLNRAQLRDLHRRGHIIGSHSVSHPARFSALRLDRILSEWRDSRYAISDLLGEEVTVASVPGGYYSSRVASAAAQAGFTALFTSEPITHVHAIDGCLVLGRFTVRRSSRPDFTARLGALQRASLVQEWVAWTGKKLAKRILGAAYPRLAAATSSENPAV
jgi:peptidoglycan/xylan/chitin deacetylase (PgdA/CDA1 family)